MSIFKVTPHIDDTAATIDIRFTKNLFGAWTSLINDDPITGYPKTFNDNRIDDNTYIQFRVKDVFGSFTDWSYQQKPESTNKPDLSFGLCFVYGRLVEVESKQFLNDTSIRFRAVGGAAIGGVKDIVDIKTTSDFYGWFGEYLSPGRVYEVTCLEAEIKRTITVPSTWNSKMSSL